MIEKKIRVTTFKNSKDSFLPMLEKNNIKFIVRTRPVGVLMAEGEVVEIPKAIGAASGSRNINSKNGAGYCSRWCNNAFHNAHR